MLETTLGINFEPGTNLESQAGANLCYLLPSLKLDRVLCLGRPDMGTLAGLARRSTRVIVVCAPSEASALAMAAERAGLPNVHALVAHGAQPIGDRRAGLIVVADRKAPRFTRRRLEGLYPLLCEGGLLVVPNGVDRPAGGLNVWVTPLSGEVGTAVPADDKTVVDYFVRHGLWSSGLTARSVRAGLAKLLLNGLAQGGQRDATRSYHAGIGGRGSGVGGSAVASPYVRDAPTAQKEEACVGSAWRPVGRPYREPAGVDPRGESGMDAHLRAAGRVGLVAMRAVERKIAIPGRLSAPRIATLVGPGAPRAGLPPAYVRRIAGHAGQDLNGYGWGLVAQAGYASRKVLFFLFAPGTRRPQYVVKIARQARFNPRLANACQVQRTLNRRGVAPGRVPGVAFFGFEAGLAVLGETFMDGQPLRSRTTARADCRYAEDGVDLLVELGTSNHGLTAPGRYVAACLDRLMSRFTELYRLTPDHYRFLLRQLAILRDADAIPVVVQHGDPGTWNAVVTAGGRTALVDWESAELRGVPLWDLFYFLRSHAISVARRQGGSNSVRDLGRQLLKRSSMSELLLRATRRYCERVGIAPELAGPLFFTCWMHRALKEAMRLNVGELERGHHVNWLRYCIDRSHSPILSRLGGADS